MAATRSPMGPTIAPRRAAHLAATVFAILFAGRALTSPEPSSPEVATPEVATPAPLSPASQAPAWRASLVVDFSGTWALDKDASDSLDPLLAASGVSWPVRKLAAAFDVTHRIVQKPDVIELRIKNPVSTQDMVLPLDGSRSEMRDLRDRPVAATTRVAADGRSVSSESVIELKDKERARLRITRSLEDEDTMILVLEVTPEEGAAITMRRVFRRVS